MISVIYLELETQKQNILHGDENHHSRASETVRPVRPRSHHFFGKIMGKNEFYDFLKKFLVICTTQQVL